MMSNRVNDEFSIGFAPIAERSACVLILGSLPGVRSLEDGQYYAQARNGFWRIMGDICGVPLPGLAYEQRLRRLVAHRVAVWDVLRAAVRPGSLDTAIVSQTVKPNDFRGFFLAHKKIKHVYFNGLTAARLYRQNVLPNLDQEFAMLPSTTLPSTSPAYASMKIEDKSSVWTAAIAPELE